MTYSAHKERCPYLRGGECSCPKKRKASGVNIPNSKRHTVQVLLRLPPDVAEALDDLATKWNLTRSGAVARIVESYAS